MTMVMTGRHTRLTPASMAGQMIGSPVAADPLPWAFFRQGPSAPALGGHDIIEKLVLIGAELLLAMTAQRGHLAMKSSPAPAAEVER
jgi:hypothetical protein